MIYSNLLLLTSVRTLRNPYLQNYRTDLLQIKFPWKVFKCRCALLCFEVSRSKVKVTWRPFWLKNSCPEYSWFCGTHIFKTTVPIHIKPIFIEVSSYVSVHCHLCRSKVKVTRPFWKKSVRPSKLCGTHIFRTTEPIYFKSSFIERLYLDVHCHVLRSLGQRSRWPGSHFDWKIHVQNSPDFAELISSRLLCQFIDRKSVV